MTNKNIVDKFFDRWSRGDLDGAMDMCTDDVVWDNIPMKPIAGKAAISAFLGKFATGMSDIHYEVKGSMENADSLMLEGTENYTKNGRKVSVPYMASFKFRDGRICAWSDYFDLKMVERQLA
jgi:limonene-1,2-epoxide hydrolase